MKELRKKYQKNKQNDINHPPDDTSIDNSPERTPPIEEYEPDPVFVREETDPIEVTTYDNPDPEFNGQNFPTAPQYVPPLDTSTTIPPREVYHIPEDVRYENPLPSVREELTIPPEEVTHPHPNLLEPEVPYQPQQDYVDTGIPYEPNTQQYFPPEPEGYYADQPYYEDQTHYDQQQFPPEAYDEFGTYYPDQQDQQYYYADQPPQEYWHQPAEEQIVPPGAYGPFPPQPEVYTGPMPPVVLEPVAPSAPPMKSKGQISRDNNHSNRGYNPWKRGDMSLENPRYVNYLHRLIEKYGHCLETEHVKVLRQNAITGGLQAGFTYEDTFWRYLEDVQQHMKQPSVADDEDLMHLALYAAHAEYTFNDEVIAQLGLSLVNPLWNLNEITPKNPKYVDYVRHLVRRKNFEAAVAIINQTQRKLFVCEMDTEATPDMDEGYRAAYQKVRDFIKQATDVNPVGYTEEEFYHLVAYASYLEALQEEMQPDDPTYLCMPGVVTTYGNLFLTPNPEPIPEDNIEQMETVTVTPAIPPESPALPSVSIADESNEITFNDADIAAQIAAFEKLELDKQTEKDAELAKKLQEQSEKLSTLDIPETSSGLEGWESYTKPASITQATFIKEFNKLKKEYRSTPTFQKGNESMSPDALERLLNKATYNELVRKVTTGLITEPESSRHRHAEPKSQIQDSSLYWHGHLKPYELTPEEFTSNVEKWKTKLKEDSTEPLTEDELDRAAYENVVADVTCGIITGTNSEEQRTTDAKSVNELIRLKEQQDIDLAIKRSLDDQIGPSVITSSPKLVCKPKQKRLEVNPDALHRIALGNSQFLTHDPTSAQYRSKYDLVAKCKQEDYSRIRDLVTNDQSKDSDENIVGQWVYLASTYLSNQARDLLAKGKSYDQVVDILQEKLKQRLERDRSFSQVVSTEGVGLILHGISLNSFNEFCVSRGLSCEMTEEEKVLPVHVSTEKRKVPEVSIDELLEVDHETPSINTFDDPALQLPNLSLGEVKLPASKSPEEQFFRPEVKKSEAAEPLISFASKPDAELKMKDFPEVPPMASKVTKDDIDSRQESLREIYEDDIDTRQESLEQTQKDETPVEKERSKHKEKKKKKKQKALA
ncbi:hypothetical protein [Aureibacter tunicatorum]|uniref:Uncharacterized protein n=1 Tax=Aureibacter tunicatorum TaxID=866807 RepID=A0AAE4BR42_9BACT|nr:hypothetical protein [Aureibacter tunicatorum]MDR6238271.1 hypothetical protein [Aureibacter tunicatorum]BDD03304.1 hypothetical protein AUTU_07870 [Aureibacter tunicatorum]